MKLLGTPVVLEADDHIRCKRQATANQGRYLDWHTGDTRRRVANAPIDDGAAWGRRRRALTYQRTLVVKAGGVKSQA
jgi:hypothetical protein